VSSPVRVLVVDDHALVRAGLRTALREAGFEVAGEASDGPEALRLARELQPDIMIVDIGLPGMDGIDVTRTIRSEMPKIRVVMLTMHELENEVYGALAAGADAYCVKSSDPSGVITAIRATSQGAAYFDPRIAHLVLREFGAPGGAKPERESPLTQRETEILRLVAEGSNNVEIADRLAVSLGTVKGHIRDILDKLSAADRTQAAVIAIRRRLI